MVLMISFQSPDDDPCLSPGFYNEHHEADFNYMI